MAKEFCSSWEVDREIGDQFYLDDIHYDWDDYHCAQDQMGIERAQKFMEENPGAEFYKFHYADEDGDYFATLEHGNLFHKLPHITISHH
jgi:hypothetical protein